MGTHSEYHVTLYVNSIDGDYSTANVHLHRYSVVHKYTNGINKYIFQLPNNSVLCPNFTSIVPTSIHITLVLRAPRLLLLHALRCGLLSWCG